MKHYNIPIFVPHRGCPHTCVFCNQKEITGSGREMDAQEADRIIRLHLATLPEGAHCEAAFFGGSFTGIPEAQQRSLLEVAAGWLRQGKLCGVRLSTRPDYISERGLSLLKDYGVTAVELGVQSMHNEVLDKNERGHSPRDVEAAVGLLRRFGFETGLQMMTGMYGSTAEMDWETGLMLAHLAPDTMRIYPTVVLDRTKLADLYREKRYTPPTLEETIVLCSRLYAMFQARGIRVIRMGLQATDEVCEKGTLLAGPYHSAFGELVRSRLIRNELEQKAKNAKDTLVIPATPRTVSAIVGQKRENIRYLEEKYHIKVEVRVDKASAIPEEKGESK